MPSHFASSFCPHIVTYPVRLRLLSALHWYYPLVLVTSSLSQLKHTDLWLSGTFVFVSSTADDGAAWTHVHRCFLSLTQSAACRTSLPLCSKSSFTQSIHLFFCLQLPMLLSVIWSNLYSWATHIHTSLNPEIPLDPRGSRMMPMLGLHESWTRVVSIYGSGLGSGWVTKFSVLDGSGSTSKISNKYAIYIQETD